MPKNRVCCIQNQAAHSRLKPRARAFLQAFYLATTGRPGPVLIDIPKDVQQQLAMPDWDVSMAIAGYMRRLPSPPSDADVAPIAQALHEVLLLPNKGSQVGC